jgi:hypothetical protein
MPDRRAASWICCASRPGLGVVGGALDVATVLLRRAWLGQFTARSRDVLWLAPLGYVLVFALGALLLGLIAWRRPRFPALWLTVFAAAAGIALSVTFLLLGQRLHPAALGLLALGLGAQAARLAAAREAATLRLARRAAPWLLVALLAVAAVQLGGAGPPGAAGRRRPAGRGARGTEHPVPGPRHRAGGEPQPLRAPPTHLAGARAAGA